MKKNCVWVLVVLVLLQCATVSAQSEGKGLVTIPSYGLVEDEIGLQKGTQIVVGSTTELSGYFATDMWGNNASDMDVRSLLHGYSTVVWTTSLGLALDGTAVSQVNTQVEPNGNRVYTITLQHDLCYNDGTALTARDYAFSLLLSGAPEMAQIGATPMGLEHIVGYPEYRAGEASGISGVKLLSESAFSIEVGAQYSPYFYGLALLAVTPYPMRIIAPGCEVFDDGKGVYIGRSAQADSLSAVGYVPGEFSADMLRVTLLDPEEGYVFAPRITSGPYQLVSFDAEAHKADFVVNELYKGNFEGKRPHIERIVYKKVSNETMLEELQNGNVDLLNKVSNTAVVNEGFGMVYQQEEDFGFLASSYPRSGLVFLGFACEQNATASRAVRNAIAHCIDQDALVTEAAGNTGMPVYGYYGLGQWMAWYTDDGEQTEVGSVLDAAAELSELQKHKDLELAKQLLIDDGWTLNENGAPFEETVDTVRFRSDGGELMPLIIRWAKTEGMAVGDIIEASISGALSAVGIGLEVTEMPFSDVAAQYYRQEERTYDMFYLASNFQYLFDPYYDFNTADAYQGIVNPSGLRDEELMQLALEMRRTDPTDLRGYVEKWLAFQRRFAQEMPMIPLYSNIYYDFYANWIQDYAIEQYPSWAIAITYAWIGDPIGQPDDGTQVEDDEIQVID